MSVPLPPPDAPAFYASTPSGQVGPLSLTSILAEVAQGRLAENVPVFFQGAPGWIALAEHPELRARLQAEREKTVSAYRAEDEARDKIFVSLIKDSWDYYHEHERSSQVDEVLVGALIASTLDNGFSLIDLNSDGGHHNLRFESMQNRSRIVFRVNHLTAGLVASRVMGQRASVVIGYGEPVPDFGRVWQALKAEYKSGYIQNAEPGTITVDADMAAGYIYVEVDMYWQIDRYVKSDLTVDYPLLTSHVGASIHALRKYLNGRIGR